MMDSQEEEKRIYATKQEVLDRVKELAQEENPSKQDSTARTLAQDH